MGTTTRRTRILTGLLMLGGIATLSTSALAAPAAAHATDAAHPARPATSAALLEKNGEAKFDAEDYEGALADFTAAEEAAPSPRHQWFIGHSQDHLQHYRAAVEAYAKFTSADPTKLGTKLIGRLAEAGERTAAIKAMPGVVHVETTPAAATLVVDGATVSQGGAGSSPFDVSLAPGPHALRVTAPRFEAETVELDVAYASKRTLTLALHEAPPPPAPSPPPVAVAAPPPPPEAPPPPPHPVVTRHELGWISLGLAVATAGFGTAFGIVAITSNNSFNTTPTIGRAYRARDFAVYSDVTFGAAVALGVTSLVLLLGGGSPDAASTPPVPRRTRRRRPFTPSAWTLQREPASPFRTAAGAGAVVTLLSDMKTRIPGQQAPSSSSVRSVVFTAQSPAAFLAAGVFTVGCELAVNPDVGLAEVPVQTVPCLPRRVRDGHHRTGRQRAHRADRLARRRR